MRTTIREKLIVGMTVLAILCLFAGINEFTIKSYAGDADNPAVRSMRGLGAYNCTKFQSFSPNSTTAMTFTQTSMDSNTSVALITVETASIRFRMDGTAPTTSVGHILYPPLTTNYTPDIFSPLVINSRSNINKFQAISVATHGKIMVTYCE